MGEKLKQARLEAGLSQRQLCGEEITRNMLSQIENGSARPSMATLRYLASRLGKSVSYFLEEDAVTSPNQTVMERARAARIAGDSRAVAAALEEYRAPDPVFDAERELLHRMAVLGMAREAAEAGKEPYAAQLLEQMGPIREGYCAEDLERRRLLLLGGVQPRLRREVCDRLPDLDEELLLRASGELDRGRLDRCAQLLEAAEDKQTPHWNFLRGEVYMEHRRYKVAVKCFQAAETEYPRACAARLERCYRELGNFERAYFYACRQREER